MHGNVCLQMECSVGPIPEKAADYTYEHAAVMFDISASSGNQFARMEVNWKTLEKIDSPTENVEYMLWKAKNTDIDGYTSASISAFESAYNEVHDAMENVWAKQTLEMNGSGFAAQPVLDLREYSAAEKQAMAKKLADGFYTSQRPRHIRYGSRDQSRWRKSEPADRRQIRI